MGGEREQADLDAATAHLDPPFAVVDLDAFDNNAADLVRRAAGTPIRVASKSVRVRALLDRVLERPGFLGILAFTLAEALWLAGNGHDDLLVAYPTADRAALRALAGNRHAAPAIAIMVDDLAQLDLVDAACGADRTPIRVCLDLDASWRPLGGRLHVGARRSPVHTPAQAASLARTVVERPGFVLAGVMAYEAQIAGVGDRPPGAPLRGAAVRWMQRRSAAELAARRAAVVAAVREHAPGMELVSGGGTGSIERTVAEPAVTEVAAGSGLLAPTLFDAYTAFAPHPAALFCLPVVRRPGPRRMATLLGGGYPASGAAGADRLPRPWHPAGLRLDRTEGAGEVQTPVVGDAARCLRVGDRVWLRHAKAGELCERFAEVHLVRGGKIVDTVPTYRGEGCTFL